MSTDSDYSDRDRDHPARPPRASTYEGLDALRRHAQDVEADAKARHMPEPGIFCNSYPLPTDLGEPDEREYRTASPRLGLPTEILTWRDKDTGKKTVIHRFRVGVHGFDDG